MLQVWDQSQCQLHGSICLNQLFERIGRTDEQLLAMNRITTPNANGDASSTSMTDHVRVTSFLVHDEQLWLGSSTGIIYVFTYSFQNKSVRSSSLVKTKIRYHPRSLSITSHMIGDRHVTLVPDPVHCRKQARSRSDSAMIDMLDSSDECWKPPTLSSDHQYLYRIAFPMKASAHRRSKRRHSIVTNPTRRPGDSGDTSTTLASDSTASSSPAVISTDECCQDRSPLQLPTAKPFKALEPFANMAFNLLFKAKIADAPVKHICKTR